MEPVFKCHSNFPQSSLSSGVREPAKHRKGTLLHTHLLTCVCVFVCSLDVSGERRDSKGVSEPAGRVALPGPVTSGIAAAAETKAAETGG